MTKYAAVLALLVGCGSPPRKADVDAVRRRVESLNPVRVDKVEFYQWEDCVVWGRTKGGKGVVLSIHLPDCRPFYPRPGSEIELTVTPDGKRYAMK